MIDLLETREFRVTVTGDKSGETYTGDFSCFRRLSHRQELSRDRVMRELLGEKPDSASERAKSQAEIFADLSVCLKKTPDWWKSSGNGLDLVDDNVLQEIWAKTIEIRLEAINEVKKKGEEAQEKLKRFSAEKAEENK